MTLFTHLSFAERNILASILFLSSVPLLTLVLYGVLSRSRPWKTIVNSLFFAAYTGFSSYVMAVAVSPDKYSLPIEWFWLLVIAIPAIVYSVTVIVIERIKQKNKLSPSAVKEMLDDLDSGVCFADGNGRITLINVVMAKLVSLMLGKIPQTLTELQNVLNDPKSHNGVERMDNAMYRFPDGKVWRFVLTPIDNEMLKNYTQITAQDVTEICETNEEIRRENERIREAIEETQRLMLRLADRVREQETLALKIKIHNDIGASLLALSQILSTGNKENAEEQLRLLQHAVWHFTGTGESDGESVADVSDLAKTLGITLTIDGTVPTLADLKKIIVLAAKECVTNCSKHAKGTAVNVRIIERKDFFAVTITNDGIPPKEPIKEGGGLTSLRETVEKSGGEMFVSHDPAFAMILNLPKEVKRND